MVARLPWEQKVVRSSRIFPKIDDLVSYFYGILLLFIAFLIVQSTDLVLSALLLAACFFTTSFWLAAWGFDYIAVVYQLVYLGAVIVLFLFVVMFLDSPRTAGSGSPVGALLHSGGLVAVLGGWLFLLFPAMRLVFSVLDDLAVVVLALDPFLGQGAGSGFFVDRGSSVYDLQLAFMQYFFTDGWLLLVLLGLLFTVALAFSLFLILVFAV